MSKMLSFTICLLASLGHYLVMFVDTEGALANTTSPVLRLGLGLFLLSFSL
jgi:hypothetical protein